MHPIRALIFNRPTLGTEIGKVRRQYRRGNLDLARKVHGRAPAKGCVGGGLSQSLAQGQRAGPVSRILHNIGYRIIANLHAQHGLPIN
jgi:hypothetical protein